MTGAQRIVIYEQSIDLDFGGGSLGAIGQPCQSSMIEAAEELDIDLVEPEDWSCCGGTAGLSTNGTLSFIASARNLFQSKKISYTPVTTCGACHMNPRKTAACLADFLKIKSASIRQIV